jgi:glyoxylase-like metal-dependent hydrolase (beta-lactamase superfamily II)
MRRVGSCTTRSKTRINRHNNMMQFGEFKLHIVRECLFKLDGGAMFGVVPKTLWNKVSPSDELNRIDLACNLLVIETPDAKVLIETGMGPRWTEKERERFEIRSLVDHSRALSSVGIANDEVDAIVISHMHFDHLGGAVIERDAALVPAYPKAKVYVQKGEYELAKKVNSRGRASYRTEDYEPLERAGLLKMIDGEAEIVAGVKTRVTGGHTSHHQVITFESQGKKGVFFADIIPTKGHLTPPWVMGYDHYPLDTCDAKDEWLTRAAEENWLVVFDHELDVPWGYVTRDDKGKFTFAALPADTIAPAAVAR